MTAAEPIDGDNGISCFYFSWRSPAVKTAANSGRIETRRFSVMLRLEDKTERVFGAIYRQLPQTFGYNCGIQLPPD